MRRTAKSKCAILALAPLVALAATIAFATAGDAQNQGGTAGHQSAAAGATKPMRIRIGGNVQQAKLISAPQPEYPPPARQASIEGNVVLHAVIGLDGTVAQLSVISGHPLLVQAALDAVKQWRYAPTLLNGEPVEVDTTITIAFKLDASAPAQQTPPAESAATAPPPADANVALDPQLKADILHLFDVMHVREREIAGVNIASGLVRAELMRSLPPTPNREKIADRMVEKVVAVTQSDEVLDRLAAVYAKSLSDDDVKAITAFYESPAGQHFNAATSQITSDSARLGHDAVQEQMPRIFKELCNEYPELQGQANFCPKPVPSGGNQGMLEMPEVMPLRGKS